MNDIHIALLRKVELKRVYVGRRVEKELREREIVQKVGDLSGFFTFNNLDQPCLLIQEP